MAEIVPFHGLRYDQAQAGTLSDLICPPYDVISEAERERLYQRSPHNFVRLEYGRPEPGDDPAHSRYSRAKALLDDWLGDGIVRIDSTPCFYLYDHRFEAGGRRLRRRGFLGALRLYQFGRGIVRPHEQTIPKDKTDRLHLLRSTRVNTSPVFGLYEDPSGQAGEVIESCVSSGPARLVGEARVGSEEHRLWAIDDDAKTAELAAALKDARIYLADGHHRYEVGLDYMREDTGEKHIDLLDDPERFVLTYLCALDDPGLLILPTHRIVSGARAAIDEAIARSFDVSPVDKGALADTQPSIVLVRDGKFLKLDPKPSADLSGLSETARTLPVSVADTLLIAAARSAGGEVRYEHDTDRAIDSAAGQTDAILLRAVDPQTLQRVADQWERLPPKTTYFYPKVPAGLVARPLGI